MAPGLPATLTLRDENDTTALAERFAELVRPGDTLLLDGPIGAGKTHFARALIKTRLARAGRDEDVPSPTFTLVQTYDAGDAEIWHADLYRLSGPADLAELGLADAFAEAIVLVEWPDRLGEDTPKAALRLAFEPEPQGDARRVRITSEAPDWAARTDAVLATSGALDD